MTFTKNSVFIHVLLGILATRKMCLISVLTENKLTQSWFVLVRVDVIGFSGSEPLPGVLST